MNYTLQTSFKTLQKNVYISSGVSGAMLMALASSYKETPLPEIFSIILDLTDYREYLRKEFVESFVSWWENVGKLPTRVISPDQDPIIGFLEAVALGPEQLKLNAGSSDLAPLSVLAKCKHALKAWSGKNSILHIKVNFQTDAL
ncbi:hypothetical protein J3Q64DRAFT_1836004 [Phycomyces blakesleeanus]|uniref:Uncharacterized protein n=1 Tax=Phycomyces blakesleeanus TaxID=4837 RepID=A0ABR3AXV4_PHYBL